LNSDRNNSHDSSSELVTFIQRFFYRHGAAVEANGPGLDILVPAGRPQSMHRKFRRGVINLGEYYASLEKEMRQRLDRSGLSEQRVQDRLAKIALIPAELARKRDGLFKKYSIRISAVPCAGPLVSTPAVEVLLSVAIGKKQKSLSAFYNPVTKTLDPLVCEGCQSSSTRFSFCAEAHLLCQDCGGRCPICFKPKPGTPQPSTGSTG
jgi:hypothetical protein